ncbi:MAG: hypothetical protein KatS3mg131_0852 [Candidatus Tectimicrobiota bacterium]|nr:MAG: hypothetical protein KatS3mg131_0852 [Candidatus Tectomicrobia bacterium]
MGACPSAQATVAEVDLGAFAHNLRVLRQQVSPGCRLMAVLKADAYGHGATVLAATAVAQGITHLAVACCQEGIALRQAGISGTIVVLGPLWPEEAEAVVAYRLTPVLASLADGAALNQAAGRQRRRCPVHVNIDTGMGRLGLVPQVLPTFLAQLRTWRWLRLEGLMTHLATADAPDPQGVQQQLATFKRVRALFAAQGWQPPLVHVANSAALFRYPRKPRHPGAPGHCPLRHLSL